MVLSCHGRDFVASVREKTLKITTVRGIVRTLSAVLSQAVEDELLPANPALKMGKYLRRGDEPEPEPDPFTREEVEHVVATAREHFLQTGHQIDDQRDVVARRDRHSLPGCFVRAQQRRPRRVRRVEDKQPAEPVGEIDTALGRREAVDPVAGRERADLNRGRRVGDVDDTQLGPGLT